MIRKFFLGIIIGALCLPCAGQSSGVQDSVLSVFRFHSLGSRQAGLGWGNEVQGYSGIKLNGISKDIRINGVSMHVGSDVNRSSGARTNGVDMGLFVNLTEKMNGFSLSLLFSENHLLNGVGASALINYSDHVRGVTFANLAVLSSTCYGFSFSGGMNISGNVRGLIFAGIYMSSDTLQGVGISGMGSYVKNLEGVMVSLVNICGELSGIQIGLFNRADRANGVQLGLLNRIDSNPWPFKMLPLLNIHRRKRLPLINGSLLPTAQKSVEYQKSAQN
jgi:hypothetical protein